MNYKEIKNVVKKTRDDDIKDALKLIMLYLKEKNNNNECIENTIFDLKEKIEKNSLSKENKNILITRMLDFKYGNDLSKIIKLSVKEIGRKKEVLNDVLIEDKISPNGLLFNYNASHNPIYILTKILYMYSLSENPYLLNVFKKYFNQISEDSVEKILTLTSKVFSLMLKENYDERFKNSGLKKLQFMEDDFLEFTEILKSNSENTFLEKSVFNTVNNVRYDKIQLTVF